ncbi:hypothetical protein NQ317_014806 [Molorchus minor]|uniref:SNARE-complex protein Syntaxin-18 N-terminal domain-containing protein n=1 Tax=Molorchus minor TaxID=1323400 RepID=A0ABQ9JW22_9CUCU|nr:hypothetical protein NQ317_014806 [Molorchus minor]
MDITTLFKACVKTVRDTNKTQKDIHLAKAKEIVKQISHLQEFFLENKAAYLNVINYLSTNKTITEMDRQKIDHMAESIISRCTNLIKEYKKDIAEVKKSKQKEEHYKNVIETLERYLKNVSKIYTEAKAVRVKRVIETHKLSKLETKPSSHTTEHSEKSKTDLEKQNEEIRIPPVTPPVDCNEEFSAEEMQMFESENDLLYNELNSISDEVKHMESKVVHIAELQEVFTEKVLQQEKDIERIATAVVGSTENVKDANEQIRQAIQRNAGLRYLPIQFRGFNVAQAVRLARGKNQHIGRYEGIIVHSNDIANLDG